jgi:hypothetical protein
MIGKIFRKNSKNKQKANEERAQENNVGYVQLVEAENNDEEANRNPENERKSEKKEIKNEEEEKNSEIKEDLLEKEEEKLENEKNQLENEENQPKLENVPNPEKKEGFFSRFSKKKSQKPPKVPKLPEKPKEKKEGKGLLSMFNKKPKPPKKPKEKAEGDSGKKNFGSDLNKLRLSVQKSSIKSLNRMKNAGGAVHTKIMNVKKDLQSKVTGSVKDFLEAHKMRMNEWIYLKIQESILKLLSQAHVKIKKGYADKNMPKWIKSALDDLVDDFWPDIEAEILFIYQ